MAVKKAPVAGEPAIVKDDYVTELDGVEVRLPSLSYLRPGLLRRVREMSQTNALFTLLELTLPGEAMDAVDALDVEGFEKLMKDWREHSGVSLGES